MRHELKIDPDVFNDVVAGVKSFEIRKDDRGFNVGDILHLMKTKHTGAEMASGAPLEYSGYVYDVGVKHILKGPAYGLKDGWVIMSITI